MKLSACGGRVEIAHVERGLQASRGGELALTVSPEQTEGVDVDFMLAARTVAD